MRVVVIVVAACLAVSAPVAARDSITIAVPMFPVAGANPFDIIQQPTVYALSPVFEALTRVDNDGAIAGELADSWQAPDPLTWRFHLRGGLHFSDGEPLDAEAVQRNIEILKSPAAARFQAPAAVATIVGVTAVSPTVVEFKTATPDINLPRMLSIVRLVAPKAWTTLGPEAFARQPAGAGMYRVERWTPTEINLVASPYATATSAIKRVTLRALPDPSARVQALLSGGVDMALSLGPDDTDTVVAAGHRMEVGADPGVAVIAFILTKTSPLNDRRVREALNLAVDKQAIVDQIIAGKTRIATQTAPHYAVGFDPDLKAVPYDPARARALLKEAGFANGFAFTAEMPFGQTAYAGLANQRVASDLKAVGVALTIRPLPGPKYARGIYAGEWEGEAIGIEYPVYPTIDALEGFRRHSCLWPHPWFCDREIMPTLSAAMAAYDPTERARLTKQVLGHYRRELPAILLYELVRFDAVAKSIAGFKMRLGTIDYSRLSVGP